MLKQAAALMCLMLLAVPPAVAADVDATVYDDAAQVGEFQLADHNGAAFGVDRLKGRWSIVFLGYTHCPDVCPFTLANLAAVLNAYRDLPDTAAAPQVVFVAVDPDRDAAGLADYISYFDPAFVGVTGGRADIDALVKSVDGFYKLNKKREGDDAYEVSHSASVAVISPDAGLKARINPPFAPQETAEFLKTLFSTPATN